MPPAGQGAAGEDPLATRERVRPELTWFLRHAAALGRWPVLTEDWARRLEARRLSEGAPPASPPRA